MNTNPAVNYARLRIWEEWCRRGKPGSRRHGTAVVAWWRDVGQHEREWTRLQGRRCYDEDSIAEVLALEAWMQGFTTKFVGDPADSIYAGFRKHESDESGSDETYDGEPRLLEWPWSRKK